MGNNLSTDISELLERIVQSPPLHAKFLNTLSLMELSGAQKIARSLAMLENSEFLLEHVAEEYRHAYFLRKLANQIAKDQLTDSEEDLICKSSSQHYIPQVNRQVCLILKRHGMSPLGMMPYLLSTYTIERRALPFYRQYQLILSKYNINMSVKSILSEEESHLEEMEKALSERALPASIMAACLAEEEAIFRRWLKKMAQKVNEQIFVTADRV